MNVISVEDRIFIIKCYYVSAESPTAALRTFKKERGLVKDPFTTQSIKRLVDKFETTGSVLDQKKSGRPSLQDERCAAVEDALQNTVTQLGCSSTRRISEETSIPHSSVHRILRKKLRLFPYKFTMLQELKSTDPPLRLHFAKWLLDNQDKLNNILWSDECHFYMNGAINTKNCVIWSSQNPRAYCTMPLHSEKVTVWMGVSKNFSVLPFFFDESVTGQRYLSMLNNHLLPSLRRNRKLRSCVFMHDGAPAHIFRDVKDFLLQHFGNDRVISRHFPQFWPPRSPDLNPCDYWLWGHLQAAVYHRDAPNTKEELMDRITQAAASISQDTTAAAIDNLVCRLEAVVSEDGGHIEHLL